MNASIEIVTVDATNVAEQGFFCYKSKPKSVGYRKKLDWLARRFAEGLRIKILHEGDRSVGFVEYIPGEYAWRAVNAEGYMVIHCMWVVGKGKGKGYGSRLLGECVEDARKAGQRGVVMVSSSQPWLAGKALFVKNGFEVVGQAPPTFELLVKQFGSGPLPAFPDNWDERLSRYGSGLSVVYADQCPYVEDAVKWALRLAGERGVKGQTVKLETSQQVRNSAPSAYGIFNIVYDGRLVSYKYISSKKERETFLELLGGA
jgi:ribosomal protein S18 acetylase RimI-like enzyme